MKGSEILELALSYIENKPEAWYKGSIAGDKEGNPVSSYNNPKAVCWCSIGLVSKATLELLDEDYSFGQASLDATEYLYPFTPEGCISSYNDDPATTHEDIVRLFKNGISAAKVKESRDAI